MKFLSFVLLLALLSPRVLANNSDAANPYVAGNDVTWTTLGKNENDSMPIGNGDLAANVWTEQNGDIVLLLAKADAWTETGKSVKLGRVRVKLTPNPFAGATDFHQTLKLETATIELTSGSNAIEIWIDANHPVIHVEGHLEQPTAIEATAEFWRKTQPYSDSWPSDDYSAVASGDKSPRSEPDIIFPATADRIAWCHFNPSSYYPYLLKQEHLESAIPKYPDPLLHRCFGAALLGPGLVSRDDHTLQSTATSQNVRLDIVALTQKQCDSPKAWQAAMDSLISQTSAVDLAAARSAHESWWQDFWNRSWIHVSGTPDAEKVSQGYIMQRYMIACSSRGELPTKFNGGLFTVGHDLTDNSKQTASLHDPDYRAWGDSYWNQNNRLLYWPLIATGDLDFLKPWFDMYLNALPLATDRTRIYYHHAGAHFPETMDFWGIPNLQDFGKNNPTNEIQSHWQKYHIQGSLEVIAQMLDVYDFTQDPDFARKFIPFADAIVTFYDQHYPRDASGKIRIAPAQSLETYQIVAVNPTPDIAGLMDVLPRLIALPDDLTTESRRVAWAKTLKDLPPIPIGKTAHNKIPPLGQDDPDGRPEILPAEKYGKTSNSENPELYVAFPYRLYGVGKPNLKLAQDTFAARRSPQDTCWGQDGTESAVLGITSVAQKAAIAEFTDYGDERYPWFWKPGHDWIPDLDNGGDGMITLQLMLMQCDGKRIQLLPAWPAGWTADFKLHAPYQTTVQGHVENGKVTNLVVIPQSRAKDVVVLSASN
jgi:alpha-L-fucosidase 2